MKNRIIFIFSLLLLISCNDDDGSSFPEQMSFSKIGKGEKQLEEYETNLRAVVSTQEEWDQMLELFSYENGSFEEVDIDFSNYQIIVVKDVQGTADWALTIDHILQYDDHIHVITRLSGGSYWAAMCVPYHIVKMTKSDKPVVFD